MNQLRAVVFQETCGVNGVRWVIAGVDNDVMGYGLSVAEAICSFKVAVIGRANAGLLREDPDRIPQAIRDAMVNGMRMHGEPLMLRVYISPVVVLVVQLTFAG